MSQSRRQDREKKKRERERRAREQEAKRAWAFGAAERERATWPIERAWVPCPDAWAATANGLVAVERRQPDGRYIGAFFTISMMDDGLAMAADLPDCAAGEFAEKLDKLGVNLPPYREGPVEAAACFLWGAYALSIESGRDWGRYPTLKSCLALMPKPPGAPRKWADILWDELTPEGLVRVISRAPHPADIPDSKEVMIWTAATFDADEDPERLIKILRKARPEFVDDGIAEGARLFTLTRPYPKGHWSPLSLLGGRQVVGQVEVRQDAPRPTLVVTGKTISMTCVVIQKLKRLMGDTIRLAHAEWKDLDDLRAGVGGNDTPP